MEGFLVRLTSASGRQARFGKLSYQKLYFTSHDNLLFFCSPSKAIIPPPPNFRYSPNSGAALQEETGNMPIIWASTPYILKDSKIQWLEEAKTPAEAQWYDEQARSEYERCVHLVYLLFANLMVGETWKRIH